MSAACRLMAYFTSWGLMDVSIGGIMPQVAAVAAACTLVESFPATVIDDNWSVPLTAAAMCITMGLGGSRMPF